MTTTPDDPAGRPPADPYAAPTTPGATPTAEGGAPAPPPGADRPAYGPAYGTAPVAARNGLGTAAMVLGIVGLVLSLVFVGALPGLVAIILGFAGRGRVARGEATNGGAALTGIITGLLSLVVPIVLVVAGVNFYSHHKSDIARYRDCQRQAQTSSQRQACLTQYQKDLTNKSRY